MVLSDEGGIEVGRFQPCAAINCLNNARNSQDLHFPVHQKYTFKHI